MTCPCGEEIQESYYYRKTWRKMIYTRKCRSCGRQEKSTNLEDWYSPARFWEIFGE